MYKCYNCEETFNEPIIEKTTYESYYGVSSEFNSRTPLNLSMCPYCGSESIFDPNLEREENEENEF